jgi:hypothetical protein
MLKLCQGSIIRPPIAVGATAAPAFGRPCVLRIMPSVQAAFVPMQHQLHTRSKTVAAQSTSPFRIAAHSCHGKVSASREVETTQLERGYRAGIRRSPASGVHCDRVGDAGAIPRAGGYVRRPGPDRARYARRGCFRESQGLRIARIVRPARALLDRNGPRTRAHHLPRGFPAHSNRNLRGDICYSGWALADRDRLDRRLRAPYRCAGSFHRSRIAASAFILLDVRVQGARIGW